MFFGLALLIDNPPDMIPDPAFSPVPVALNNLFVVQNATGPCGPVEWVCALIFVFSKVWLLLQLLHSLIVIAFTLQGPMHMPMMACISMEGT